MDDAPLPSRELCPARPGPLQFTLAEGLFVLTVLGACFAVFAASLTAGFVLLAVLVPALARTALVSYRRRDAGQAFPLWEAAVTLGVSLLVAVIAESLFIALSLVIGVAGLWVYVIIDPEFAWPGVPLVIAVIVLAALGGALAVVWCVFLGTWPPRPAAAKTLSERVTSA